MKTCFLKKILTSKNKLILPITGLISGIISGLLGAGGGLIIVPILKKCGIPTKKVHATSTAIILPICSLSALIYLINQKVTIQESFPYIPLGFLGTIIGSYLLQKLDPNIIGKIFGIILLWAAVKMLF